MTVDPITLLFASIFTSNILLTNFLGMCSYISISKDLKSSNGLGMAVSFVMTVTTVINWFVYHYIIVPFELEYLRYIIFIIVIAAVVQIMEMIIDRISPTLYLNLGIFLPLITVNCAILGVTLFMQIREYTLIQSLFYGLGSGLGWWLAIVLLAAIRKKTDNAPAPAGLKGNGLTFITIGIMAMAFMGFSGMIKVQ
ncbi:MULTISPECIES: NADH:ubiquinone reductase (Na(+)-transporting) subunit E [Pseudothermotoga]|jgi:Na+-transporting NADH:ubiquinone oxidoreductase subunit E|uniref:Ion-translocating oxidoreductase complex subunit A n=1 Tax=Pseudothermotoga lettingae (strain ATCC BAA-301 / DSM 14385 / NBRC 107922 / TMO) TaxID=416591 RepID=A8F5J8_PSELT|nr:MULTISPECIES: Rnf-Nqr domain containing protein [Pseudothermotoga]ABV33432.1 RnfA-Nqr electron transport subunit [Pseudothermotoga lettingae TMO]KUK21113.1 MAG: RnfA-Nqr electron transport subunit [Pseudothermotoga lettingae]MDK2883919.1 Na+-transporting NADH:ubiquinone oxidoreductase subunit [Pseudothermotoga sp.]GLI49654.1 Na(+)-translocating NADH-quinone reductase subunit E [Pseudothermotoga lettingae TMO]HBJ80792.1 NADH:ubiquinone reductase (Na(+)-transporting) subunit E [Pseudothermoto